MGQIVALIIGAILLIGGFFSWKTSPSSVPSTPETETSQATPKAEMPASATPGASAVITPAPVTESVKEFTVTGSNFSFAPNVMQVKKGDKVRVIFKNADGFHDFKIDELGVATSKIQGGAEETVEFVASKTGSFEYYCSVGSHRQMGMKGTLIVTE